MGDDKLRRHFERCAISLTVAVVGRRKTLLGGTCLGLHCTLNGRLDFVVYFTPFIVETERRLLVSEIRSTVVVLY